MMKKSPVLQYRHEVKQYLLPTLTYYLRLLELPNIELEAIVSQALEENQLLEEVQPEAEETAEAKTAEEKPEPEKDDFAVLELYAENPTVPEERPETEFDPTENMPAEDDKLIAHLQRQAERKFKDRDLELATAIIANIEDDGYLSVTTEEMAGDGYGADDVDRIIKAIRQFDPVGCAWRDIRDALLAQLEAQGFAGTDLEYVLVRDHLHDLRHEHAAGLIAKLGINEEQYQQAKKTITKLNPFPGLLYSGAATKYVLPDFIIRWQDNNLVAHLRDNDTCRIKIKSQYLEMLKHKADIPRDELDFIRKKAQSAQNLIIAIEQRRKTLNRIINTLLDYQRDFFERGPENLRPITMTDFARQLNVNPSTISRAIANKYVESPWGIHKMKFFFSAPVAKTNKRLIHDRIRSIITAEDDSTPLSDAQIAKKLSREGIFISRRTVTKYRELLNLKAQQFRRKT